LTITRTINEQIADPSVLHLANDTEDNRQKRKRKSISKEFFFASSEIYLLLNEGHPRPPSYPDLLGQVVACPNKKNDSSYTIKWCPPANGEEWPPHLSHHLQTVFGKEELSNDLSSLIDACPLNNRSTNSSLLQPIAAIAQPATLPQPFSEVVQNSNDTGMAIPADILTTPSEVTRGVAFAQTAFADFQTAGSMSVSTLGNSDQTHQEILRSRRRMATRGITIQEPNNDSDQCNTESENEYNVDFNENFWETTEPSEETADQAPDDATPNQEDCLPRFMNNQNLYTHDSCDGNDFANLLQNCSNFQFEEVTREQSASMEPRQKTYDGPSGLRRNVSHFFQTPLGAFCRAGFTKEMVGHWTRNSNR
jgi:hypothetical protein